MLHVLLALCNWHRYYHYLHRIPRRLLQWIVVSVCRHRCWRDSKVASLEIKPFVLLRWMGGFVLQSCVWDWNCIPIHYSNTQTVCGILKLISPKPHLDFASTVFRSTSHESRPSLEFRTPTTIPDNTTRLYSVSRSEEIWNLKKIPENIIYICVFTSYFIWRVGEVPTKIRSNGWSYWFG